MGPNPLVGVIYHWIGGLASASNFIPFRPIKRWSWEIYWIIQGFAAWIVAPLVLACVFWCPICCGPACGPQRNALAHRYLGSAVGHRRPHLWPRDPLSGHCAWICHRARILHRFRHPDATHLQRADRRHLPPDRGPGHSARSRHLHGRDCSQWTRRLFKGEGSSR